MIKCFERLYQLSGDKTFLLQLPHRITAVQFDSGTGKSYVINQIKLRKSNFRDDYSDTIIVDNEDAVENLLNSSYKDKIIIIDRYDYFFMQYPLLRDKILEIFNDNHFLIFARGYTNLPIRPSNYTEMIFNKDTNQFLLYYRFLMPTRDNSAIHSQI